MLRQTIFARGTAGYASCRIPALLRLPSGRLLAFCEGRLHSQEDYGRIDTLVRFSDDGGRTFSEPRVAASDGVNTVGNPAPVYAGGRLFLFLNGNLAEGHQGLIMENKAPRTILLAESRDEGESWSPVRDLTGALKKDGWTWHACGPCHALVTSKGRIVIPCTYAVYHPELGRSGGYFAHAILSDDGGDTWRLGGSTTVEGTNECSVCELSDGSLYLNLRSYYGRGLRTFSISRDGGESWSVPQDDPALPEPVCQGSVISDGHGRVYFLNPADPKERVRMTLRESRDDAKTWGRSTILHEGPSAYSDLALMPGEIACLFECGETHRYERIDLMILPRD